MRPAGIDLRSAVTRLVAMLAGLAVAASLAGCLGASFLPTGVGSDVVPDGVEVVRFQSDDGVSLEGRVYPAGLRREWGPRPAVLPPSAAGATVIFFHGVYDNADSNMAYFLRDAGFRVFQFDYRGFGRSGKAPLSNPALIADAQAALDYVRSRPDVDPERVVLYGHSLGGVYAIAAGAHAVEQGRPVRAVISSAAFSSWNEAANGFVPVIGLIFGGVDGPSPRTLVRRLGTTPLLITHAQDDDVIDVGQAHSLHHHAIDAGVSATLLITPIGGHVAAYLQDREFARLIARYIVDRLDDQLLERRRRLDSHTLEGLLEEFDREMEAPAIQPD